VQEQIEEEQQKETDQNEVVVVRCLLESFSNRIIMSNIFGFVVETVRTVKNVFDH
jgi:hypothetical protein